MAIEWTVSHDDKLVTAVANHATRRRDYPAFLTEMSANGLVPYRKIFDLRYARLEFTAADLRAWGQRVVDWGNADRPGPTALLVDSDLARELADMFTTHARANRPVAIFTSTDAARAWLDEVAPVKT